MIRSNRNLFRVFPTRLSPALTYPNKRQVSDAVALGNAKRVELC